MIDQRGDRQSDADRRGLRVVPDDQRAHRLERHVGGESEERERHQPQRLPLAGLGHPVAELPQDDQAAGDLDDRVESEPDQGDRPGDHAGGDRDDRLDDVVGHRCAGQQLRTASEPGAGSASRVAWVCTWVVMRRPPRWRRRSSGTASTASPVSASSRSAADSRSHHGRRCGSATTSTPGLPVERSPARSPSGTPGASRPWTVRGRGERSGPRLGARRARGGAGSPVATGRRIRGTGRPLPSGPRSRQGRSSRHPSLSSSCGDDI